MTNRSLVPRPVGAALLAVSLVVGGCLGPGTLPTESATGASQPVYGDGTCPTSQPPALPAGEKRTVTIETKLGTIIMAIEADLSPIAAGNLVALAECGFYGGVVFHRTPTLDDGTRFVIQGGDPTGTGRGGPGYMIPDEPVVEKYGRGTVAMARSQAANSVGSQFFIVLEDSVRDVLESANTYQIIGTVASGMEVADAIHAASAGVELPTDPVAMTKVTVTNP